ncbi:MAG: sugar phosphate nucleotidyltransferase [Gemmatimonadales bacterium]
MKAVVIAAGSGSRLRSHTEQLPKTLLPFGRGTILSQILHSLSTVGVDEFVIVVGYLAERIASYLAQHESFGFRVKLVENLEWRRGNGISVLRARDYIGSESFLLSMSDHLVNPLGLATLQEARSPNNLLLVDPRLDAIVDLADATKVWMEQNRIVQIGKELEQYNGFDCGVFKLNQAFFDAMAAQLAEKRESISDGVRRLIQDGTFEGVLLPEGADWIDVDTPETYRHALAHRARYS